MGTNYYATRIGKHSIHIGKKSSGWQFSYRAHPQRDLTSHRQWMDFLGEGYDMIHNEYGESFTPDQFAEIVEASRGSLTMETYYEAYPHHDSIVERITGNVTVSDEEGFDITDAEFS